MDLRKCPGRRKRNRHLDHLSEHPVQVPVTMTRMQEYARDLFLSSLAVVDVENRVSACIDVAGDDLRLAERVYDLRVFDRIAILAVGKAAAPMSSAAMRALGPVAKRVAIDGIVISGEVPDRQDGTLRYLRASHPLPDETSREAAERASEYLKACDARTMLLFLVSGGASAMLEKPLDPTISVEDTRSFYRLLVHSGLSISRMNCLRKHFSATKGGRLAALAGEATQCSLLISDVPSDDLSTIGSGPSVPDLTTREECLSIAREAGLMEKFPESVRRFFQSQTMPETLKPADSAFRRSSHHCVLSSDDLVRAATDRALADGFHTEVDLSCDDWPHEQVADHLLARVSRMLEEHRRVCLVSGGEVSVPLPAQVGMGGRNQQFALKCAEKLARVPQPITVLSAGSDGLDGNSPAAGAVVDEHTWWNALDAGFDPAQALSGFDSFPLFREMGLALICGATGNNLRDLRLLLAER